MEELSSSDTRDEIVSQHLVLRGLVTRAVESAHRAAGPNSGLDDLRCEAQALYDALAAHMMFEERVLPAALRDVIGWGAVLQQRIEEDHSRQREALSLAIAAIRSAELSAADLAENVRAFASTLLGDIDLEEGFLLQADLDEIASRGAGG